MGISVALSVGLAVILSLVVIAVYWWFIGRKSSEQSSEQNDKFEMSDTHKEIVKSASDTYKQQRAKHPKSGQIVRVNGGREAVYNDKGGLVDLITGLLILDAVLDSSRDTAHAFSVSDTMEDDNAPSRSYQAPSVELTDGIRSGSASSGVNSGSSGGDGGSSDFGGSDSGGGGGGMD